ncbi:MAG: hypothetical protein NVS4B3_10780 [Gemmatimonadaceae bacterium]
MLRRPIGVGKYARPTETSARRSVIDEDFAAYHSAAAASAVGGPLDRQGEYSDRRAANARREVRELLRNTHMTNPIQPRPPVSGQDWITWLIVGLVAGVLASFLVGGIGYGLIGEIVVGIVGAFIGGWMFGRMHWRSPFSGLANAIFIAFIGAVILLIVLHVLRGSFG